MSIKIERFEVKSTFQPKRAIIVDHSTDSVILELEFHQTYKENKALAEKLIPIIEAEIEE